MRAALWHLQHREQDWRVVRSSGAEARGESMGETGFCGFVVTEFLDFLHGGKDFPLSGVQKISLSSFFWFSA